MSCSSVATRRRQPRMIELGTALAAAFHEKYPGLRAWTRRLGRRRTHSRRTGDPPGLARHADGNPLEIRGTMTETDARDRLVAHIRAERALWANLVTEIGEDRMTEPGPMGEWTFKDLASHLLAWRERRSRASRRPPRAARNRRTRGRPTSATRRTTRSTRGSTSRHATGRCATSWPTSIARTSDTRGHRRAARGPGDAAGRVPVAWRQGARRCRAVRPPARRA